jgi:hypothetical protein
MMQRIQVRYQDKKNDQWQMPFLPERKKRVFHSFLFKPSSDEAYKMTVTFKILYIFQQSPATQKIAFLANTDLQIRSC